MKINKSKILRNAMLVLAFLVTTVGVANTHPKSPLRQDEGPPEPPGVAIDNYTLILLISAIVISGVFFYTKKNSEVKKS